MPLQYHLCVKSLFDNFTYPTHLAAMAAQLTLTAAMQTSGEGKLFQNQLSLLCLAILLICIRLTSAKLPCSVPSGDEIVNNRYADTSPSPGQCLQFVVSIFCSHSKAKGPVCRDKLVLIYLCSLLLAESYAPEPNPRPRPKRVFIETILHHSLGRLRWLSRMRVRLVVRKSWI